MPEISTHGALRYLHERGAHFVLANDKKPIWKRWNVRKPSIETVLHHIEARGGEIGLIPNSLRTTAVDVDAGPVEDVIEHLGEPLVILPSRARDDGHCYYHDQRQAAKRELPFRPGSRANPIDRAR